MDPMQLKGLILATSGCTLSVTFTKADGSVRRLVGRTKKPGEDGPRIHPTTPAIALFDFEEARRLKAEGKPTQRAWRTVRTDRIRGLKSGNLEYVA